VRYGEQQAAVFANVRSHLSCEGGTLCRVTSTQSSKQPEWGKIIQARREKQGRSVRQAALIADLSDAYWGQIEKGYVSVKGERRPITPSRRALLAIADSLRMTTKETAQLLESAGHKGYVPADSKAPRESEVDLTGLSRRDVALLNALADRFREKLAQDEPFLPPAPLKAVASSRPGTPRKAAPESVQQAARDAAARNPEGRRQK
jgi:transcriptional regulator with XRE-family HTH domain